MSAFTPALSRGPRCGARLRAWLLAAGCAAALAAPAATGPAASNPVGAVAVHTGSVELAGRSLAVDVYLPSGGTAPDPVDEITYGLAIVAHGFTRSRVRHRDLGEALAAAGVAVVVPDLPHVVDHWGNGEAIEELVHRLEGGALGLPPAPRSRILLIGTSAGGFATVLAAAELPGLAGWIGLDPVDRTGSARQAASRLTAPAVVLRAEPSGCNLYGSARSIARALPVLLRDTLVDGASHCDFEAPTTKLCRVLCGESSPEAQSRVRGETVEAALEMLGRAGRAPMPPHATETP